MTITITVRDEDQIENLENAIGTVENELDATIRRERGRPAEDEITLADVVDELAIAYTGVDLAELDGRVEA